MVESFSVDEMISDFVKSLLFIGICLFNESDRFARTIFFCSDKLSVEVANALFSKNALISLNVVGIKISVLLTSADDKDVD
jgi:hypothetical protein